MPPTGPIYTVSRLNQSARQLLESGLGQIWLTGEISNFSAPASGHWYFTLKDDLAQVRSAMFRGRNSQVAQRPRSGDQVLVRARVSLYEPRGDYQLIVEYLEPAGDGLLRQQFEQLKMKLAAEGLFASAAKQPLPAQIQRIGVITSASGAALRDILQVLARRDPLLEVIIYPSAVQGADAPRQLASALQSAIRRNEVDVLLLARGGGSLEDLWAFNDEQLARQIAACPLPVISGVGHEIDTTIADFVADLRAPTPSAAAELVSSDSGAQRQALARLNQQLAQAMQRQISRHSQQLHSLHQRLHQQRPDRRLERQFQQTDELTGRLHGAMARLLQQRGERASALQNRLHQQLPVNRVSQAQAQLAGLQRQLEHNIARQLEHKGRQLALQAGQLNALSPLATLSRGYSITTNARGKLVDSIEKIKPGERIGIRVQDGQIEGRVEATRPD